MRDLMLFVMSLSLNPYYTGSYSMSKTTTDNGRHNRKVLILIILEVTLWVVRLLLDRPDFEVLILIILEVTLWDQVSSSLLVVTSGLNPYYTGSYSMSWDDVIEGQYCYCVLILIILEVTLWVAISLPHVYSLQLS